MMDSFTHYSKSNWLKQTALRVCVWFLLCGAAAAYAQVQTELSQAQAQRGEEGVLVSAQANFELPPAVEDALLKGIAMVFVVQADLMRERWYWYDKRVAGAARYMRLAYQPLTRRWRLNIATGPNATGLALNQSYDTLEQAMQTIRRVSRWKIADVADLEATTKYRVELSFRLDLSQLPRPFQIGTIGQTEWDIAASTVLPLATDVAK